MSLILVFNLILIPKIDVQAVSYSAATSFTYNYQGYNYQFYFSGLVDSPENYSFDSSALDYLLQKSAEGINISVSSGIGAKISNIFSNGFSAIFNLYRNFVIATDKLVVDWIVWDDIYGFEFQFIGLDPSYPGNETYGPAYGWRFIGWLGEKIDLVLDSQGMLYGSNPIGNYTFSEDQEEFGTWSINQHDGDDIWLTPHVSSFEDFPQPYFTGTTLNLTYYDNNDQEHLLQITNFERCFLDVTFSYSDRYGSSYFIGVGYDELLNSSHDFYDNGVLQNFGLTTSSFSVNTPTLGFRSYKLFGGFVYINKGNLPSYNLNYHLVSWNSSNNVLISPNKGVLNRNIYVGSVPTLWLDSLTTTPLPDPIVLPVDDPIPITDIQPDPVDFTPDPDDEPDPVPGIDYPVPGPTPVPVPPLPPLVSGNDDLWPDVNGLIAVESGLDSYLGVLGSFEFTPLQSLVEGFVAGLTWVSMVMMTLYNGSDFSILFVVLSMFFIAACLLGVYKWWTH